MRSNDVPRFKAAKGGQDAAGQSHSRGGSCHCIHLDDGLAKEYGIDLSDSVNAIMVKTKTGELKYTVCALLATTKLDINKTIRKKLGARRVSFADIEETARLTVMEIGGVTPLVLPNTLSLWVDSKVMKRNSVVLGGGNRSSKIKVSPKIFNYTLDTEIVDGLAN